MSGGLPFGVSWRSAKLKPSKLLSRIKEVSSLKLNISKKGTLFFKGVTGEPNKRGKDSACNYGLLLYVFGLRCAS